jgi:integrase
MALIMALTHTALQALKPKDKSYAVTDRDGLYIDVLPTGSMVWRYKYYFAGKREKLTIGRYPAIGLAKARELRDDAAAQVAIGKSPAKEKQSNKIKQRIESARSFTFQRLAEQWFDDDVARKSEKWQYTVRNWLKLDIYPSLGEMDPREITEDHIQEILRKVMKRNAPNSANKVRVICSQVFEYGIDKREVTHNPAAKLKPVKAPETQSHRALAVKEIKPFLDALEADNARLVSKVAIKLLMLTLSRKDELRLAKWPEFDLENGVWEIPAHRMKMRDPHRVYLSRQVLELLAQLQPLSRPDGFILPSNSTAAKPIGHTTINNVIDRLDINGARFVPHGFRATASSLLNEANFRHDVIERQLAHKDRNKVRATYNQAEYAHERRDMLQWWADYIDSLKLGSNVVPINARRFAYSQ